MQADFWHERWQQDQIGFHQRDINQHLRQFWPELGLPASCRVFVPLCGKSSDMLWLRRQGHTVVGVELSRIAVDAFFAENGLQPEVWQDGDFQVAEADGIRLYCGDFFALDAAHLQGVCGIFDRAALVALPPPMRAAYAAHLQRILAPGTRSLLVTFDYPQPEMPGPPFSVPASEVRALFAPHCRVTLLHDIDILQQEPRFREKGLSRLQENVYRLSYNEPDPEAS